MNNKITLKMSRFPQLIGDLTHSNQFLKIFAFTSLISTGLCLLILFVLVNKPPVVLTMANDARLLEKTTPPKLEDQIKMVTFRYIEKRYNWNPSNVKQRLDEASYFIHPASIKAYWKGVNEVERFSKEKMVSQRVYPENIKIDQKTKSIQITGDRVTSIQGLRAAGDLNLVLYYSLGNINLENPWGIYIIKEEERL